MGEWPKWPSQDTILELLHYPVTTLHRTMYHSLSPSPCTFPVPSLYLPCTTRSLHHPWQVLCSIPELF